MRKTLLLLMLLLCALLLTACYTDNDPWVTDSLPNAAVTPVVTNEPAAATAQPTAEPTSIPLTLPDATSVPILTPEPTEVPGGGSEEPGING